MLLLFSWQKNLHSHIKSEIRFLSTGTRIPVPILFAFIINGPLVCLMCLSNVSWTALQADGRHNIMKSKCLCRDMEVNSVVFQAVSWT